MISPMISFLYFVLVIVYFLLRAYDRPSLTSTQRILAGAARIRAARLSGEVSE